MPPEATFFMAQVIQKQILLANCDHKMNLVYGLRYEGGKLDVQGHRWAASSKTI